MNYFKCQNGCQHGLADCGAIRFNNPRLCQLTDPADPEYRPDYFPVIGRPDPTARPAAPPATPAARVVYVDPVWVGIDLCKYRRGCQCGGAWLCTRHDIEVITNYADCKTCLIRDGKWKAGAAGLPR